MTTRIKSAELRWLFKKLDNEAKQLRKATKEKFNNLKFENPEINQLRRQLKFKTKIKITFDDCPHIDTYPRKKIHLIYMPLDFDLFCILHEMMHAKLAEHIHPIFSTSYYKFLGIPDNKKDMIFEAINWACDFFIDKELIMGSKKIKNEYQKDYVNCYRDQKQILYDPFHLATIAFDDSLFEPKKPIAIKYRKKIDMIKKEYSKINGITPKQLESLAQFLILEIWRLPYLIFILKNKWNVINAGSIREVREVRKVMKKYESINK